jgi:uroporphyrinogen III methyltransferase/synthase
MPQKQIHAEMIAHARAGLAVVRLKGGDPFIFGRGFEELTAAREAGIACEVVPGITSAIAAPASAGIPVTCRGKARTFAIATPQTGTGSPLSQRDYVALAAIDTLSLLMPLSELTPLCEALIAAGRSPSTPAAIIEHGTTPRQRTHRGTLASFAAHGAMGAQSPALFVVGDVVACARESAREGALAGRTILVTRPHTASGELTRRLRLLGAHAINAPLISIHPAQPRSDDWRYVLWDWIIFCSLHGVREFWRELSRQGLDARWLASGRVAAVGPKTAAELRRIGIHADFVPSEHRAHALAREFATLEPRRNLSVLFPCGTLAREELPEALHAQGHVVHPMLVYETRSQPLDEHARARVQQGVDAILLYSPSAVRGLAESRVDIGNARIICVGPTTARAARDAGLGDVLVPNMYGDAGVIELLLREAAKKGGAAHGT